MKLLSNDKVIAIILSVDDWEGLYINDTLVCEDHSLNNYADWINWTIEYNLRGVKSFYISNKEDLDYVEQTGLFKKNLKDWKGNY